MKRKIMPTHYLLIFLILAFVLHILVPVMKIISGSIAYTGLLFIAFGVVINLWTDRLFKKGKTTVKPFELPASLETSGPFRISRHPMYLGMLAILLGTAVLLGSLMCFIAPVLFPVAMEIFYISHEERNMEKVFGSAYLEYKKRVRRWI